MKKTKLLLLALGVLSVVTISSSFAYYGQNGYGRKGGQSRGIGIYLSQEERTKLMSMSPEERYQYIQQLRQKYNIQKGNHSNVQRRMLYSGNIQSYSGTINEEAKEGLINQYGEEKMARDLYNYAYEKYGLTVFKNIAASEQQHMDALKTLLDKYGIEAPTDYAKDNELYSKLKAQIDESLQEALNVGVTVETVDIKDIENFIKQAKEIDAKDLITVYVNIAGGSYNHLKGFLMNLKNLGYDLPDVSEVLPEGVTVDDLLNIRGIDAKNMLINYLKEEGIDVENDLLVNYQSNNANYNRRINYQNSFSQNNNTRGRYGKYINTTKVNQYQQVIQKKYMRKFSSLPTTRINTLIQKINLYLDKIINSNYSETTKEKYVNALVALKNTLLSLTK